MSGTNLAAGLFPLVTESVRLAKMGRARVGR